MPELWSASSTIRYVARELTVTSAAKGPLHNSYQAPVCQQLDLSRRYKRVPMKCAEGSLNSL